MGSSIATGNSRSGPSLWGCRATVRERRPKAPARIGCTFPKRDWRTRPSAIIRSTWNATNHGSEGPRYRSEFASPRLEADGGALVFLGPGGPCGSGDAPAGVYHFERPGVGAMMVPVQKPNGVRMWGTV